MPAPLKRDGSTPGCAMTSRSVSTTSSHSASMSISDHSRCGRIRAGMRLALATARPSVSNTTLLTSDVPTSMPRSRAAVMSWLGSRASGGGTQRMRHLLLQPGRHRLADHDRRQVGVGPAVERHDRRRRPPAGRRCRAPGSPGRPRSGRRWRRTRPCGSRPCRAGRRCSTRQQELVEARRPPPSRSAQRQARVGRAGCRSHDALHGLRAADLAQVAQAPAHAGEIERIAQHVLVDRRAACIGSGPAMRTSPRLRASMRMTLMPASPNCAVSISTPMPPWFIAT